MRVIKEGNVVEFAEYEVVCSKCECQYVIENENDHTRLLISHACAPSVCTSKCPQCHFVNERLFWHKPAGTR